MAKKLKLNLYEGDVIIIVVEQLPETGQRGVWYFYNNEYWYWGVDSFISVGGDRPTKPPVNP